MTLPPLPVIYDDGYDFIEQLQGGWYVIPAWGSEGWDAGSWPLIILVHYDGDDEFPYGMTVYTEGDIDLKEFKSREARNRATDEWAVWWWTFNETEGAPTELSDSRLGPYRGYG